MEIPRNSRSNSFQSLGIESLTETTRMVGFMEPKCPMSFVSVMDDTRRSSAENMTIDS